MRPTAPSSSSTDLGRVAAWAGVLAGIRGAEPPAGVDGVAWEDNRAATWDALRESLRPVAEADAGSPAGRLAAQVRALAELRIQRLERGEVPADGPGGELAGLARSADVVACAFLVDDLRRLDEAGRISGELGWAMRRWAWSELRRALARSAPS